MTRTLARLPETVLPPLLIGHQAQRFSLLNCAREAGIAAAPILLEPHRRNTALAVASAVAWVEAVASDADPVLVFLPADHHIAEQERWTDALLRAVALAQTHSAIALIGMDLPEFSPALGYMGCEHMQAEGTYRVAQFIEKPASPTPLAAYSRVLANSGQVIARASVLRAACMRHAPHIWDAAVAAIAQGRQEHESFLLADAPYQAALPIAFDRAVLELDASLVAVEAACGWQDIGTAEALCALVGQDNSWFAAQPLRVDRPWGYYEWISQQAAHHVKRLFLYPHARLSLQRHERRAEHWTVIAGVAQVELEGESLRLKAGESLSVPQGAWHRLSNAGGAMLQLMEVQTGAPDEADIERAEDDYGRV